MQFLTFVEVLIGNLSSIRRKLSIQRVSNFKHGIQFHEHSTKWRVIEETTLKQLFTTSLNRCKTDESFISSFYERFMDCSKEIRDKFQLTDFKSQNEMLLRSLELSADATSGNPEALEEIHNRGRSHDREHLDIRPELY